MIRFASAVTLAFLFCLLSGVGLADTYWVFPDGSGDFSVIQDALFMVASGDTIVLGNGTFTGAGNRDLLCPAWDIVLRSESLDPTQCVIDCEGSSEEPHRVFDNIVGDGQPIIAGITFTNGYMTEKNETGGLVRIQSGAPLFRHCVFTSGYAEIGGCVSAINAHPVFERCRFTSGSARMGAGAIGVMYGSLELHACTIENNASPTGTGGAVFIGTSDAPSLITDCEFQTNFASNRGGALGVSGDADVIIIGSHFEDNWVQAYEGGAIHSLGCDLEFSDCRFIANRTLSGSDVFGGGAVDLFSHATSFSNCLFACNESAGGGGAIRANDVLLDISACTLVENGAQATGGGLWAFGDSEVTLSNTIIAFSTEGAAVSCGTNLSITLACCDLYGNAGGDWVGCIGNQQGVDGNFSEDPLFCMDDAPEMPWSLAADSPCTPENNPDCGLVGTFGVGCAPIAIEHASWSAVKTLY